MSQAAPSVGARGTRDVAIAGVAVAAVGMLVQLITARLLNTEQNTQFIAFWAALYLVIGITVGIQTETTRAVRAALEGTRPQQAGAPVVGSGLAVGLGVALVAVVPVAIWAQHVIPGHAVLVAVLVAGAALAFSGHAAVTGALAGRGEWRLYARVTGLESVVRMVLVAVVALVAATLTNFLVASAVATAAWLVAAAVSRGVRGTFEVRSDRAVGAHLRGIGHAMLASASTAVIVVGFPVLLSLTTPSAEYATSAPLLIALSLTRAPLLLPLNVFQGVVITHLVSNPDRRRAVLAKVVVAVLGLGVVGGLLAYVLGPPIMRLFTYDVPGLLLAELTAAGALLALLTLCGTAVLAAGRHGAYSLGWVLATVVSVVVLLAPWSMEVRTVVSLVAGPAVGILVHLMALLGERPSSLVGAENQE